jgi:hypothetical protein
MKKLLLAATLLISTITSTSVHAYTRWTAINPWEVCHERGGLKILTMVNTGAGFLEFHRFDREFVSCEEVNGQMVLQMNLYHKSANDMEAGFVIKRKLFLPHGFCSRKPDVVRFNDHPNEEIVANGKFSGPKTLAVQDRCRKHM